MITLQLIWYLKRLSHWDILEMEIMCLIPEAFIVGIAFLTSWVDLENLLIAVFAAVFLEDLTS